MAGARAKKGDFAAAVAAAKKAVELDGNNPDFKRQLQSLEHLQELEGRLPGILKKEAQPASALERLEFARLCSQYKQLPFAGLKLFTEAFAAEPKLLEKQHSRYQAACAAAQVGCGLADDAGPLDEAQRTQWRKQALTWLTDALASLAKTEANGTPAQRKQLLDELYLWRRSAPLECVRDAAALKRLPESEQQAWTHLWQDVASLAEKVEEQ
jgi:hypothetical protein